MNNSLSAHRQVLIKKSGRTIECLAPNSEVVNLKCFFYSGSFHLSFHMLRTKKNKKKRSGQQARPRHPENSKRVAIFFQVPRDPLPAVRWDERVRLLH